MTLKMGEGHQNQYEYVKLNRGCQMQIFKVLAKKEMSKDINANSTVRAEAEIFYFHKLYAHK